MQILLKASLFVILLVVVQSTTASERLWTSHDGEYQVAASLVSADETQVELKTADGAVISVKRDQLSKADNFYVATLCRSGTASDSAAVRMLESHGIVVRGSMLTLKEESRLRDCLAELKKRGRVAMRKDREAMAIAAGHRFAGRMLGGLDRQSEALEQSMQLYHPWFDRAYHRLAEAKRANQLRRTVLQSQQRIASAYLGANADEQQMFIEEVSELRSQLNAAARRFIELTQNEDVTKAISRLSAQTGQSVGFRDGASLMTLHEDLLKLENAMADFDLKRVEAEVAKGRGRHSPSR